MHEAKTKDRQKNFESCYETLTTVYNVLTLCPLGLKSSTHALNAILELVCGSPLR
jgi:hypothetical protein